MVRVLWYVKMYRIHGFHLTIIQQLRAALEKALSNNPLLVSFYVLDQHQNPHYVTLKPSSRTWDLCLLDHGSLKTSADVQQLAIDYPMKDHARAPGPLFRCLIVHVEETGSAAMVMYGESSDISGET